MTTTRLKYGIPDIELQRVDGGSVNPSSFAGHPLIVVFCPSVEDAEALELARYADLACKLSDHEAWLITVSEPASVPAMKSECFKAAAYDGDGSAWAAFRDIAPPGLKMDRTAGATFLFGRGGSFQRIWSGAGHASDVLRELSRNDQD